MTRDALWQRLEAFSFDDPQSAFSFSDRLARDNGWGRGYALEVIGEYRRFLYVAMRAGHPVTPSDEVDQAWHLHLCYTRSYWDDLCGKVLGEALHHGPTRGGSREKAKFRDWYRETLGSYERLFGEKPPRSVWPAGEERFGNVDGFRRLNLAEVIVVPRLVLRRVLIGVAALAFSLIMGCGVLGKPGGLSGSSAAAAIALFALAILVVCVNRINRRGGGKRGKNGKGGKGKGAAGCGAGGCGGGGDASSNGDGGGDGGCGGGSGCGGCGGCG